VDDYRVAKRFLLNSLRASSQLEVSGYYENSAKPWRKWILPTIATEKVIADEEAISRFFAPLSPWPEGGMKCCADTKLVSVTVETFDDVFHPSEPRSCGVAWEAERDICNDLFTPCQPLRLPKYPVDAKWTSRVVKCIPARAVDPLESIDCGIAWEKERVICRYLIHRCETLQSLHLPSKHTLAETDMCGLLASVLKSCDLLMIQPLELLEPASDGKTIMSGSRIAPTIASKIKRDVATSTTLSADAAIVILPPPEPPPPWEEAGRQLTKLSDVEQQSLDPCFAGAPYGVPHARLLVFRVLLLEYDAQPHLRALIELLIMAAMGRFGGDAESRSSSLIIVGDDATPAYPGKQARRIRARLAGARLRLFHAARFLPGWALCRSQRMHMRLCS
jgi:hypothetical protein